MALGFKSFGPHFGLALAACCLGPDLPFRAVTLCAAISTPKPPVQPLAHTLQAIWGRGSRHNDLPPGALEIAVGEHISRPTPPPKSALALAPLALGLGARTVYDKDPVWAACIKHYPPTEDPKLCPDVGPTELAIDGASQDPLQCLQEILPTVRAKYCQLSGELEGVADRIGPSDPFGWGVLDRFEEQLENDGREVIELLRDGMFLQVELPRAHSSYDNYFDYLDRNHNNYLVFSEALKVLPKHGHMLMSLADLDGDRRISKRELQVFLQTVFCFSDVAQPVVLMGRSKEEMEGFATYQMAGWLQFRK